MTMRDTLRYWLVGLLVLGVAVTASRSHEAAPPEKGAGIEKPGAGAASAESAADIRKDARQRYLTGNTQDTGIGKLFQKAADMGDPLAVMWVARLLKRGTAGLHQDNTRAAELAGTVIGDVQKMAEAGDPEAQFLLGMAFSEPLGMPKDDAKACTWLLAAARQGEAMAMNNLAHIKLVRIYEKWPPNAKGIPTRDAAQPQRSGVRSHADE